MYYVYVLHSEMDNNLYVGCTSDLRKRLEEHNNGKVESTKSRRPFTIQYYEAGQNKEKAFKREKYLKTGFGRSFLKKRI